MVEPGAYPIRVVLTVRSTAVDGATPVTVIPPCAFITAVPTEAKTLHEYAAS